MKYVKSNKLTWSITGLMAVIAVVLGFFVHTSEEEQGFWFNHVWGFFALLGFLGCVALIFVAKWLGHYWLQRKEDYYD
jgi:hypothetical protein